MMTNTQGDPQVAQLLKLLHKFKSWSVTIDVGPFTTLLRRWELVIGHGTCQRVLTKELGMHNVAAKFVPRILTADQKQQCFVCTGETHNCGHPPPTILPIWHRDIFIFPQIKLKLKGRRFDTIEEIQAVSQRVIDTLTEKDFQEAFQKWRRW
jgi:hypothetical protein